MDWRKVKAAEEARAELGVSMAAILDKAEAEKRELTAEEQASFDQLRTNSIAMEKHVARLKDAYEASKTGDNRGIPREPIGQQQHNVDDDPGKPIHLREKIDGFAVKDLRKYSVLRAIRLVADRRPLDGVEGEINQELAKRNGEPAKGFYFPADLPTGTDFHVSERRSLNTTSGTGAIATILDVSNFIEYLRNRTVMMPAGARMLTGMVGNLALPRQNATGTAYWVADEASPTASAPTIGQVTFSPNTLGAYTDLSRKFLLQSSLSAEAFVRDDLSRIVSIEIDRAGINGSGASNQPTGILQQAGIGSVSGGTNGAAISWANVVALESAVAQANADVGSLNYISNPKVRSQGKTTLKFAVNGATPIWEQADSTAYAGTGEVNGYRAFATNQVPSNLTKGTAAGICSALIFGDFSSAVYAMWGSLDILVDPYTNSNTGSVRVVALQDLDFQLRHAASFAAITDILA